MRRTSVLLAVVGSVLTSTCSVQAEDPPRSSRPAPAKGPEGELRRRAVFGAQLAPVTKGVRERQKLDGDGGVLLEKVFPGTAAWEGGFKAGDVVLAVGGAEVTGVPMLLTKIAQARAGDVLALDVVRDQQREAILADAARLLRVVVPAHVWREDAEAGVGQGADLVAPAVPALRKAMQQHHERAGPGLDVVQPNVIEGRFAMQEVGHRISAGG